MTKNNSKNWLEIEDEYINNIVGCRINDLKSRDLRQVAEDTLAFFKPYFQEKMHEEAVDELEKVCPDHDTKSICIKCMKVVLTSVDNNPKE